METVSGSSEKKRVISVRDIAKLDLKHGHLFTPFSGPLEPPIDFEESDFRTPKVQKFSGDRQVEEADPEFGREKLAEGSAKRKDCSLARVDPAFSSGESLGGLKRGAKEGEHKKMDLVPPTFESKEVSERAKTRKKNRLSEYFPRITSKDK